jgi:hypothetical protein
MRAPSCNQPSPQIHQDKSLANSATQPPSRWTRRLNGVTRRLTRSESSSLAWRIIAGKTKPGEAHGLLRAWPAWEQLARMIWPVCEIPDAPYGLLCLRIRPYRGEPVTLRDGTIIKPGARLAELHCNNRAILELVQQRRNPFAACRHDLKKLCDWIQQDPVAQQVSALYACTILDKAADRLGFTVRPKPVNLRRRLEKFFFKGLLLLYSQEGLGRLEHGSTIQSYPSDVWLSRDEFLRLYRDQSRLGRGLLKEPRNHGTIGS